jgi:hypothetical protein
MKKILLSITAVAVLGSANAQMLSANDAATFGTWTTSDLDGDGQAWGTSDMAPLTTLPAAFQAQGEVAISNSYDNAASAPLTPDNLFISPVFTVSGTTPTLSWVAGNPETDASGWYEEYYSVYIATAAEVTAMAGGTYPTAVWAGALTAGQVIFSESVDLTSYIGVDASVVFRHHNCTDENWLLLDDVLVQDVAGINEISLIAKAFPNPANDVLNIIVTGAATSVSILSLDGKVISTEAMNGTSVSVNTSDLTAGTYFYSVSSENGNVVTNKFVKK